MERVHGPREMFRGRFPLARVAGAGHWDGLEAQDHVGGWTSTNKDLHPQLPLCTESFSFKIMTRKKIPVAYQKYFRPFGFFPVTKSNEKRQQRIYQYLLSDSSFPSVLTEDPRLLLLSKDFMQCAHGPDGRAES